jgi:hypothetical protein
VLERKPLKRLNDGRNVETSDFGKKRASVGKLVRSVPRVTAETPENGLTMGEIWKQATSVKNRQALENAPR